MKKIDDVISMLQANELLSKELLKKKEEEKENKLLWVFAIIGAIAAVAGIAYAVYRFMTPDYLDDFDDSFDDDYEDDFFDEEDNDDIILRKSDDKTE